MDYKSYSYPEFGSVAEVSTFKPQNGIAEHNIMLHTTKHGMSFREQLESLHDVLAVMEDTLWENRARTVMKRYFLSDASNQTAMVEEMLYNLRKAWDEMN